MNLRKATYEQLCKMGRDNTTIEDFGFLVDAGSDYVYITEQPSGESPKQSITIPRKVFNRFVDFYLRERTMKKAQ